ncbi:MAG: CBS domain-containing protein [Melioribacteraceae bacterium]|nr:CBS domain-containing protein [Melioribacteraceae bacterium]MCF8354767.1 CBS domain-containing protein [Melioribacteraceae bacterium]MCF8394392.1 CBS domain-containing protein [Melioribacteraceae bacterium]MCF8417512.1 CBS domain-containing protein [Melioribacteraceae bacterium]
MKSIKEILESRKLYTVKSGVTVREVIDYLAEHNIGLVPVLTGEGKLVGVFSERDLVRRVISKGLNTYETKVDEVMTKELILGTLSESHEECLQKMKKAKIRHLIIAENDKLLGIVSIRDLLELDLLTKAETIEVLNNYIYSA